jgi:hypothetical protein
MKQVFDDIDLLPLENYLLYVKKGDNKYLAMLPTATKENLAENKKKDIAVMMVEVVLKENEDYLPILNKEINELNNIMEAMSKEMDVDINMSVARVEKWHGFQFDRKNTSTSQWLSYLKNYINGGKSNK